MLAGPLQLVIALAIGLVGAGTATAHIVGGGDKDAPPVITPGPDAPPPDAPPPDSSDPAPPPGSAPGPGPEPSPPPDGSGDAPPKSPPSDPAPSNPPPSGPSPSPPGGPEAPESPASPRPAAPLDPQPPIQLGEDGFKTDALPLSEIAAIDDPELQLEQLAITFGQLLSSLDPDLRLSDGSQPSPYKVVDRNRSRLPNADELERALDITARIKLARAGQLPAGLKAPTEHEIARAKVAFHAGIESIAPHVPADAARTLLTRSSLGWIWALLAAVLIGVGVWFRRARDGSYATH